MARTVDDERRAELLERIVDYVMENGLSDLSLRPLADAVDSSPRVLLYYFGSKDELVAEILNLARARQRDAFAKLPRNSTTYRETVLAAWAVMSAPAHAPLFRLFFEVYGLALQQPDRFPGFFSRAIDDWIGLSLLNVVSGAFVLPESLRPEHRATRFAWTKANPARRAAAAPASPRADVARDPHLHQHARRGRDAVDVGAVRDLSLCLWGLASAAGQRRDRIDPRPGHAVRRGDFHDRVRDRRRSGSTGRRVVPRGAAPHPALLPVLREAPANDAALATQAETA